jgi:chromate transport protein ChrA
VVLVALFFHRFNSLPTFRKGISGVLCSFVGLLASTSVKFGMALTWDLPRIAVAIVALVALILRVNLLWIVLGVTVFSLVFRL